MLTTDHRSRLFLMYSVVWNLRLAGRQKQMGISYDERKACEDAPASVC